MHTLLYKKAYLIISCRYTFSPPTPQECIEIPRIVLLTPTSYNRESRGGCHGQRCSCGCFAGLIEPASQCRLGGRSRLARTSLAWSSLRPPASPARGTFSPDSVAACFWHCRSRRRLASPPSPGHAACPCSTRANRSCLLGRILQACPPGICGARWWQGWGRDYKVEVCCNKWM